MGDWAPTYRFIKCIQKELQAYDHYTQDIALSFELSPPGVGCIKTSSSYLSSQYVSIKNFFNTGSVSGIKISDFLDIEDPETDGTLTMGLTLRYQVSDEALFMSLVEAVDVAAKKPQKQRRI